jgi:hypothetical protein
MFEFKEFNNIGIRNIEKKYCGKRREKNREEMSTN